MQLRRLKTRARQFFDHRSIQREIETRMRSGVTHVLPDFVIAGVMKCGTTSLFNHLINHRCVAEPLVKGVKYFNRNLERGDEWYKANFPSDEEMQALRSSEGCAMTGESSPDYLPNPEAASLLHQLRPDVQLIVLLRDPVDRALSHYHYRKVRGRENRSFEEAIKENLASLEAEAAGISLLQQHPNYTSYLGRGLYMPQLRHWLEVFPKEQIKVVGSEQFLQDAQSVYSEVLEYLGLPGDQLAVRKKYNTGKYDEMSSSTHQLLCDYFRPHNQHLFEFVGREFEWKS